MEVRLTNKIGSYQSLFKTEIQTYLKDNRLQIKDQENNDKTSDFLKFIFDHDNLVLSKQDFLKRKRIKNTVPTYERCIACRANGDQCTRRRKTADTLYCGTHSKGLPHGKIDLEINKEPSVKKIEIWIEDINGIIYYIDKNNNVYLPQDIIENSTDPRVIASWDKDSEGKIIISNLS